MLLLAAACLIIGLPLPATCAPATSTPNGGCSSGMECSLNGVCTAGACVCDRPWQGDTCAKLAFKTTPASGKSLYDITDARNTWNGPIVTAPDGTFHIYDPIYKVGSLGGPTSIKHGTAKNVTGPYEWASRPDLPAGGENPAFVVFPDPTTGKDVYSLWMGGKIRVGPGPDGPFTEADKYTYVGGNPAPVYHKGKFYMTSQRTDEVSVSNGLGQPWTKYADIKHPVFPGGSFYHVEDPFMWIDKRSNWHIINHAYRNDEYEHCGDSVVSAHWYSTNGTDWHWTPQPYSHTVDYDDGTSHTYTTLERPNLHFNAEGQLTHLNTAADMIVGDEGCGNRTTHAHNGHTPCDNCKWNDHAGTIIIALDV